MQIWLLFFCPSYCIFYVINCVFLNWCRYSFVSLLFILLLVHMVKQWNIIFYFIFFIRYQNTSEPYICYRILFQERPHHHPPKPLPPSPLKWLHIDETWKEIWSPGTSWMGSVICSGPLQVPCSKYNKSWPSNKL